MSEKSLCDLIRESNPELEVVEELPEKYANIVFDYDEWKSIIKQSKLTHYYGSYNISPCWSLYLRLMKLMLSGKTITKKSLQQQDNVLEVAKTIDNFLNKLVYPYYYVKGEIQNYLYGCKYVFLECFKHVKGYTVAPVYIYKHKTGSARSAKCKTVDELTDFINENKDSLILYSCIYNKKTKDYILRYGSTNDRSED